MIWSAHRVESPVGLVGINAFRRRRRHHDDQPWRPVTLAVAEQPSVSVADGPSGEDLVLEAQYIEIPPGGNRIRSYLDLQAPDPAGLQGLLEWVEAIAMRPTPLRLPLVDTGVEHAVAFNLDRHLAPVWRMEIRELARSLVALR